MYLNEEEVAILVFQLFYSVAVAPMSQVTDMGSSVYFRQIPRPVTSAPVVAGVVGSSQSAEISKGYGRSRAVVRNL